MDSIIVSSQKVVSVNWVSVIAVVFSASGSTGRYICQTKNNKVTYKKVGIVPVNLSN